MVIRKYHRYRSIHLGTVRISRLWINASACVTFNGSSFSPTWHICLVLLLLFLFTLWRSLSLLSTNTRSLLCVHIHSDICNSFGYLLDLCIIFKCIRNRKPMLILSACVLFLYFTYSRVSIEHENNGKCTSIHLTSFFQYPPLQKAQHLLYPKSRRRNEWIVSWIKIYRLVNVRLDRN